MASRTRRVLVSGAAALAGCGGTGVAVPAPTTAIPGPVQPNATVEHVVDGDTIDLIVDGVEERVRLIGIDTPEIAHDASGDRPAQVGECFGEEAQGYAAALLPVGTPVRIERDVVARDDYGRLLGYVYRASDGIFVNYEMVRQGYAQPLTIPPNVVHSELLVDATRQAEAADAGLWRACGSG
jgi:micrococcal nuclease